MVYPMVKYFVFGSQVYGTATEDSDCDMYVIGDGQVEVPFINTNGFDIHQITEDEFQSMVEENHIVVMEAYSMSNPKFKNFEFDMNIEQDKLRRMISGYVSNSFVKAKKKLKVEKDYDRKASMKSLFHSIRIAMFGTQLAEHGKVVDFTCANHYWEEIKKDYMLPDEEVLDLIKAKYQPIKNKHMSEFRVFCPK